MPWWASLYLVIYAFLVVGNIAFAVNAGVRRIFICYDILAGVYMIWLFIACWSPMFRAPLSIFCAIPFAAVMVFEFYFSVWGSPADLGLEDMRLEISRPQEEFAKVAALLFSAPAYFAGFIACVKVASVTVARR